MTGEELWQATLGELELSISKPNFTTWFKETFVSSLENDQVIIGVPNTFTQTWLEKKYHKAIFETIQNLTDNQVRKIIYRVEIKQTERQEIISDSEKPKVIEKTETRAEDAREVNEFGLNPRYTFSHFIVGKNNELAHAACRGASEHPGTKYNPLFIYSGVGLGKTHLMQAAGQEILKNFPGKKILYVNCERFTNDYIQAVREGQAKDFKNFYRNVDVLLVDDIQFIAGKEGTQEEFFHTFNALHQKNRQIIITSDRIPKAITGLEERLISRFEWGMIADISKPDLETRAAILKTKCQEKKVILEEESVYYIASHIQKNIRELEGALNKIIAFHELNNTAPSLDSIKNILSSLSTQPRQGITNPKQLIKVIAEFYELKMDELLGESRTKRLALPRQIAMYLLREELNVSYPTIGMELGNRDHTTAIHAYNKIKGEVETESRIKQEIEMIKQRLYNS